MKSLFVTGTDTDVGKTCVTASIVNYLSKMNVNVGVMKPFASGYKENADSVSEDVEILMKYSNVNDPVTLVNPYYFEIPTSPYDACKQLNLEIDMSKVIDSYNKLSSIHDLVIVEGIGGLMTPITKNYFVSDLISDLHLNSIIVTGSKIGSVNHTMSNLRHQIHDLTGQTIHGTIPHYDSFNIQTYIENFSHIVDFSKLGFENI